MYPDDRRYSKEHEWLQIEGDVGTLGITDYAQDQLGDIVFVELPEKGCEAAREEVLGTIESVKAVSELYSPVSGTVIEVNKSLEEKPDVVNSDPHSGGWICKLRLSDTGELDALMDAAGYREFTESAS
jgi:glycine cleavage system H protein